MPVSSAVRSIGCSYSRGLHLSQSLMVPLLLATISGSVEAILSLRVLGQGPCPLALSSAYRSQQFPSRLVQPSVPLHFPGWRPRSTGQLDRYSSSVGSGFLPSASRLVAFTVASFASLVLVLRPLVLLSAVLVHAFPRRHYVTALLRFPTLASVATLAAVAVPVTAVVLAAAHHPLLGRVLH